jgi:hypothetical protein
MRFFLAAVAGIFILVNNLSAQEDVSEAKWQATPIVIDGHDAEWNPPFNLFDNKSGLVFTITNDNKNLYLCFTEKDELKAEKIMKAGWTFSLSSSEKKRKFDVSITFPKIEDPNISLRADFTNQVNYYKMDMANIKTKGFRQNNGDVPLTNKDGVNIGIGSESDQKIIYEIIIPLNELIEENNIQLNELITLDVTVNALDKPTAKSGMMTGGGGGRRGGGMGGGMRGGRGGGGNQQPASNGAERVDIFEKTSFKQKFHLVKQ